MMPLKNKWLTGNLLLLIAILTHSIYRDLQLEKQYPGDLRNRVVGARLQKDGRLPYLYHWQPEDGTRYLDPNNLNGNLSQASNITGSPFFHQLLYPVCGMNQRFFSMIWMALQYLMLAGMIWLIFRITEDKYKRLLVLNAGLLFTVTEAWKSLISTGQIYLFFAFLMICIICALVSQKKYGALLAGICMAVFILCRPIGVIVLLPLLILLKPKRLFFLSAFSGLACYGIFVLSSPFEQAVWKNYAEGLRLQVILHQADDANIPEEKVFVAKIARLEGFDFTKVYREIQAHPIPVYSENGNIFVIYRMLLHKKISLGLLNALSVLTIAGLSIAFYLANFKNKGRPLQFLLFGFSLYMIVEIFGPVHRHQYYTVQWFPLVLVALLIIRNRKTPEMVLLTLGLLLNIVNFTWLPMRHTLGEFAWLAAILLLCFSSPDKLVFPEKLSGVSDKPDPGMINPGLR